MNLTLLQSCGWLNVAINSLQLFPRREGVYFLTPWSWSGFTTCFDQSCVEKGMSCEFWNLALSWTGSSHPLSPERSPEMAMWEASLASWSKRGQHPSPQPTPAPGVSHSRPSVVIWLSQRETQQRHCPTNPENQGKSATAVALRDCVLGWLFVIQE